MRGSTFYFGQNFYVGCVGEICFVVGQFWLFFSRRFNIFGVVQWFYVGQAFSKWFQNIFGGPTFCLGQGFNLGCVGERYFLRRPIFFALVQFFNVGQTFVWIQIFLVRYNGFGLVKLFLTGSNFAFCFFALVNFYFKFRQFFSRAPSQQIFTKQYFTSWVFLRSLVPKAHPGPLQRFKWSPLWHYPRAD